MAFDSVPWMVGGGAEHSPEVCRVLAYAALGGAEGVIGVGDCQVRALSTPGGSVRILAGAAAILNRSPGAASQTYVGRNISETNVSVTPTGGSTRNDLVIVRVKDPQYPPWSPPVDPAVGPYIEGFIVTNVASGVKTAAELNLGYPAIALARLTIPASTSTITDAMITDLRKVARPRSQRVLQAVSLGAGQTDSISTMTPGSETWPSVATWTVDVPSWATIAYVKANWNGVKIPANGNYFGSSWVAVGSVNTQTTAYDSGTISNNQRVGLAVADDINIPLAMRGTSVTVALKAHNTGGTTGFIYVDEYSSISLDIEFREQADLV